MRPSACCRRGRRTGSRERISFRPSTCRPTRLRRERRRSGANRVHSGGRRHQRELHGRGIQPRLGARCVGTAAPAERSRAGAIPRNGRSPPRRRHHARRGCDAKPISRFERSTLELEIAKRTRDAATNNLRLIEDAPDGRRRERAGRAPGRAAAVHRDGPDRRSRARRSRRPRTR